MVVMLYRYEISRDGVVFEGEVSIPIMAGSDRGKTISLHSGLEQRRQWPADLRGAGLPQFGQKLLFR